MFLMRRCSTVVRSSGFFIGQVGRKNVASAVAQKAMHRVSMTGWRSWSRKARGYAIETESQAAKGKNQGGNITGYVGAAGTGAGILYTSEKVVDWLLTEPPGAYPAIIEKLLKVMRDARRAKLQDAHARVKLAQEVIHGCDRLRAAVLTGSKENFLEDLERDRETIIEDLRREKETMRTSHATTLADMEKKHRDEISELNAIHSDEIESLRQAVTNGDMRYENELENMRETHQLATEELETQKAQEVSRLNTRISQLEKEVEVGQAAQAAKNRLSSYLKILQGCGKVSTCHMQMLNYFIEVGNKRVFNRAGIKVEDKFIEQLKTALAKDIPSHHVNTLDFSGVSMGKNGWHEPILKALLKNTQIVSLSLNNTNFAYYHRVNELNALCSLIQENTKLKNISIERNWLGDSDVKDLLQALLVNNTLETLVLRQSNISKPKQDELLAKLAQCGKKIEISF